MSGGAPRWPAGRAAAAEAAMGAAAGPGGPFDPAVVARLDAAEEFPAAACAVLDGCGAARAYVPAELGGAEGGLPNSSRCCGPWPAAT